MRFLTALLISATILAGLLGGWGSAITYWDDTPRSVVALMFLLGPLMVATLAKNAGSGETTHVSEQKWRFLFAFAIRLPLGLAIVAYLDHRELLLREELALSRWFGVVLYLAGWTLMLAAIAQLGRWYSVFVTVQPKHMLMQRGVYGVIRHPVYLGFIMSMLGLALVFRSWLGFLLFLSTTYEALLKMRKEEQLLVDCFADDYRRYMDITWRMIPHLY